jgi:hypothetical protein
VLPDVPKGGSFALPDWIAAEAFKVTPTGQIATSYPHAETVHSLNLKRAKRMERSLPPNPTLEELQKEVRAVTKSVALRKESEGDAQGYTPESQFLWAESKNAGKKPAILLLSKDASAPVGSKLRLELQAEMQRLADQGNVVLSMTPRPSPPGMEETKSPILGPFYMAELRTELVGKTLLGLRVDDTIRAMDALARRRDVDTKQITARAAGHMGLVLLHAAILDPRLSHISVDHALVSYRSLVEAPMPIGAPEDILPGVLQHYDLPDLVKALGTRLTWTNPRKGSEDLSAKP